MMRRRRRRWFILTEAVATLPLIRQILREVRAARATASRLSRKLRNRALGYWQRRILEEELALTLEREEECLAEADRLGVCITSGIRCEAWFPFEHKWVGPEGDGRIRPACFVYNDANDCIETWFFSGWPHDRRTIPVGWWQVHRPAAAKSAESA